MHETSDSGNWDRTCACTATELRISVHVTPPTPAAVTAVLTITPASKCVVDTRGPVRDATSTSTSTPAARDKRRSGDGPMLPATRPVLNVRIRVVVDTSVRMVPSTIHRLPYESP